MESRDPGRTPPSGPTTDDLDRIEDATRRLLASVNALSGHNWREASILPGWTRAHVLAHLALNAEGFGGALAGLVAGVPAPVYASQQARDADVEGLAARPPEEIAERLRTSAEAYAATMREAPAEVWSSSVERVPGLPLDARWLPGLRLHEVEVHHADLGAGYACSDWPDAFATALLERMTLAHAAAGPFTVRATDLGRDWPVGDGVGTVVTGTGAELGWWLVGRGSGQGLTCDAGALPSLAE